MNKKWYVAKKIGLKYFIVSFIGLILSIYLISLAYNKLTPASVNVSGYRRSDGSYVSSYTRRPPGSVKRDAPYENAIQFLTVTCLIFGVWSFVLIWKLLKTHEIKYVLEEIIWEYNFPQVNFTDFQTPNKSANARKHWRCDYCQKDINIGEMYFYVENNDDLYRNSYYNSHRDHYCKNCKEEISTKAIDNQLRKNQYNIIASDVRKKRALQLSKKYLIMFKKELKNPELYV